MSDFVNQQPTLDAYWRSVILFGKNTATYKFALGKALLELARGRKTFVTLEELAPLYVQHLADHLKAGNRQGNFASSRFLAAIADYNQDKISRNQLLQQTVQLGFNNVIDAFHVVNQAAIPTRFYVDERKTRSGIVLTDELFQLAEGFQYDNLPFEVEARWRLVETAWSLDLPPSLLMMHHDLEIEELFLLASTRRVSVTPSRNALNGYQKGKCFYCYANIGIQTADDLLCEVDHFFPHTLKQFKPPLQANLDGVWNLVLSCRLCNRGESGKFARVPAINLLQRLLQRNEYLIESHHPLRETLMAQTGQTTQERLQFLKTMDAFAVNWLIHRWQPRWEQGTLF